MWILPSGTVAVVVDVSTDLNDIIGTETGSFTKPPHKPIERMAILTEASRLPSGTAAVGVGVRTGGGVLCGGARGGSCCGWVGCG